MDSIALPFIRRGLMKYFPSGDTFSKNQSQKDKKPCQLDGEDPKSTEQNNDDKSNISIIISCMLTGMHVQ